MGIRSISLFSGIGCTELGWQIASAASGGIIPPIDEAVYVERDPYCQRLLAVRQRSGWLPPGPVWDDVTTFDGKPWRGADLVSGGFPCTDISCAGKGAGLAGKQSGLFFEMLRVVKQVRPRYVLMENTPAILVRGMDRVLGEMAEAGYDCRWTCVQAAHVGAPQKRERWFALAYMPGGQSGEQKAGNGWEGSGRGIEEGSERADRASAGREAKRPAPAFPSVHVDSGRQLWPAGKGAEQFEWEPQWVVYGPHNGGASEPGMGMLLHGPSGRLHQLRALGNGIVPQQLALALLDLLGLLD